MKALIFLLYVVSVLTMSAFARADVTMPYTTFDQSEIATQVRAKITNVTINTKELNLEIDGYLPDACYLKPSISITQDDENPAVLRVRLTSPPHTEMCPLRVTEFSTVVNLPAVARSSELVLQKNSEYLVVVDGSEFAMEFSGEDLVKVPSFIAY